MANLVILGAGMMGTAFAWPLADAGHTVRLVGTHLDAAFVRAMQRDGVHPKLELAIPTGVRAFELAQLGDALEGAEAVVLGVSSAGVRWAGRTLRGLLQGRPLAMVSKGLEWNGQDLRVLPDVLSEELGEPVAPVGVAGPCIAGELARRVQTSVVFTSRDEAAARRWAELASGSYYHVWTSIDVVGVEACAALKNAYAMGIALAAGIHASRGGEPGSIALHNYEASVFAQSIWEMELLVGALGGQPAQARWLPGVGDLDVTCNGGRTGRFGQLLGLGIGLPEAVRRMDGATLECLEILRALREALHDPPTRGRLPSDGLPLAEHLASIALDGAPVAMPFQRFFGGAHRSIEKRTE